MESWTQGLLNKRQDCTKWSEMFNLLDTDFVMSQVEYIFVMKIWWELLSIARNSHLYWLGKKFELVGYCMEINFRDVNVVYNVNDSVTTGRLKCTRLNINTSSKGIPF
jgi:hypothetical protein